MFKNLRKRIILCGGDPDYILKLAEYVDSRMHTIADENATTDSAQLAVLAAVRIAADDLLRRKLDGCVSDSPMSNHSSECDGWENKMPEGEERETSDQELRLMTEEDKQRTRERRERHRTKRWYEKQLF